MKRLFLAGVLFSTVFARDPFYVSEKNTRGNEGLSASVVGVVICEGKAGCLVCEKGSGNTSPCFVKQGDQLGDYLVDDITQCSLVLTKGGEKQELAFE